MRCFNASCQVRLPEGQTFVRRAETEIPFAAPLRAARSIVPATLFSLPSIWKATKPMSVPITCVVDYLEKQLVAR